MSPTYVSVSCGKETISRMQANDGATGRLPVKGYSGELRFLQVGERGHDVAYILGSLNINHAQVTPDKKDNQFEAVGLIFDVKWKEV